MCTKTREEWLQDVIAICRDEHFKEQGFTVPEIHVSTGLFGVPKKSLKTVLGQCWYGHGSEDGLCHIFISPTINDTKRAIDVLIHELVHSVAGPTAKHGPAFRRVAKLVGLEGKMAETVASDRLNETIAGWIDRVGLYPHPKLDPGLAGKKRPRKQAIKLVCPNECTELCVRIAEQYVTGDYKLPKCGYCDAEMEPA